MIRVYVVDARELFRRGLRAVLSDVDDIEVVGGAAVVATASAEIEVLVPDVVIVDLDLPNGLGIETCGLVTRTLPAVRVLVSCRQGDDDRLGNAMLAGASGFFIATEPARDIIERVRLTHRAGPSLDARIAGDLFDRVRTGRTQPDEPLAALTDREREILGLLAEGLTNRQIGETLHLSPKTVKNYVSVILKKLGMSTRTEAAVYAARRAAFTDAQSG